jgi:hypothetical protein
LETLTIHSCFWVVAIDIHGLVKVVMSIYVYRAVFSTDPTCTSVFAIQAAPAHDFLWKAQTKQTATTIAKNGKL